MPLKTERIHVKLKHITKKAFVHTPDHLPKLHNLVVVAGARGSGKTYSCTNLIRLYKKENLADRVIIISPTCQSNRIFYEDLITDEDDLITEMDASAISRTVQIITQEASDYNEYLQNKALYELFKKFAAGKLKPDKIDPILLVNLMDRYEQFEIQGPPIWRYKDDTRPPVIHVMIDDCQGSPLLRSSGPLINFAIKHRHIAGIGCSLYILCQSYISTSACPRCVRENAQTLMLFRVRDEKLKQTLAEEATPAQFSPQQFLEAFEYATSENVHDFLMVDYNATKKEHIFRKNFDTFINFD